MFISQCYSPTGKDCFTIGRYAYNQKDWIHTRQWMVTALERFDEKNDTSLDVASVYDHLAFAEYSVGETHLLVIHKLLIHYMYIIIILCILLHHFLCPTAWQLEEGCSL